MAWAGGIVLVMVLALATSMAVLAAIAAAIEVLPPRPRSAGEPIDDEQSPAPGAGARVSHER
jgi:hypothetical protein